ncbi:Mms1p NDAI_0J00220 [Naumovozyma dairenensis CBS 421]|uniref:Uncharacterized protein n=1 Tax=Naumovozyma dairenensis (strain ATCC 10597 / BCRC 20456 / CBS 421 / NBRC 0211 / NRRL Y-12639) TaxID=1071378 RepID=G0WHD4_NAUDC|nr:hypothetical protein NDAI_0J00220 [Naumovozyma dairenensis CBS 421]CCD26914.1 hypothetical protein NDAI_0J00220 [Naumovozyma dairenensis CBS 421]
MDGFLAGSNYAIESDDIFTEAHIRRKNHQLKIKETTAQFGVGTENKELKYFGINAVNFKKNLLAFKYDQSIVGAMPKYCFKYTYAEHGHDPDYYRTLKRKLAEMQNGIDFEEELYSILSNKELKELNHEEKDPETLDDSDLEEFANSMMQEEASLRQENTPRAEVQERPKNLNLNLKQSYITVTENSIQKTGSSSLITFPYSISDCQPIVLNETSETLLLVVLSNGIMYSILPGGPGQQGCTIQYWVLESASKKWSIMVHPKNENFVLIDKQNGKKDGLCKFFKLKPHSKLFGLVSNLYLPDSDIIDANFFPNESKNHFLLFIALVRYQRKVHLCIEWTDNGDVDRREEENKKNVHQLIYLNGDIINGSIPISHNKCLAYTSSTMSIISANQIMSGETFSQTLKINCLRNIKSSFYAPELLTKLQTLNKHTFGKFQFCSVIATSTGNISFMLSNDAEDIEFYSLTRFKGLKWICSSIDQPTSELNYNLIIISFGRTLKITVNLNDIKLLHEKAPSNISSLSGLVTKTTLASSTEQNTGIISINPSKNYRSDTSELWLTSPSTLTQLNNNYPAAKTHLLCTLSIFQEFSKIILVDFSELEQSIRSRILLRDEDEDDDENADFANHYLIIGTNYPSISKAYVLNLSASKVPKLFELDDILCCTTDETLHLYFTENSMVQITRHSVFVLPLLSFKSSIGDDVDANTSIKEYKTSYLIEGAAYCSNKVILWSVKKNRVEVIDDIDNLCNGDKYTVKNEPNMELLLKQLRNEFVNIHLFNGLPNDINGGSCNGGFYVLFFYGKIVKVFKWDVFNTIFQEFELPCKMVVASDCIKFEQYFVSLLNGSEMINPCSQSKHVLPLLSCNFNTDVELRKISDKYKFLIFSTNEIHLCDLKSPTPHSELKIPMTNGNSTITNNKCNPILDVQTIINDNNSPFFILRSDGLQIVKLSYNTWNYSNYLLKSTRNVNKTFFFLDKINRMLVINRDSYEWDCIKLTNGKILSLNSSILRDVDNESALLGATEVRTARKDEVLILLNYDSMIKLIKLLPQKGNLLTKEVCIYKFQNRILGQVLVNNEKGECYVLSIGDTGNNSSNSSNSDSDSYRDSRKLDAFIKLKISDDKIIPLSELRFNGKGQIIQFEVCDDNIIMSTTKAEDVYVLKDYSKQALDGEPKLLKLNTGSGKIGRIKVLDDHCFLVIVHKEGETNCISSMLFYKKDSIQPCVVENEESYIEGRLLGNDDDDDDMHISIFDKASTLATGKELENRIFSSIDAIIHTIEYNVEGLRGFWNSRAEIEKDDELGNYKNDGEEEEKEVDEYRQHKKEVELELPKLRSPYQTIRLDKIPVDITYNRETGVLYCLCSDQTVLKFVPPSLEGYKSRTKLRSFSDMNNFGYKLTETGIWEAEETFGSPITGIVKSDFQESSKECIH